jgi:hypothetical protein
MLSSKRKEKKEKKMKKKKKKRINLTSKRLTDLWNVIHSAAPPSLHEIAGNILARRCQHVRSRTSVHPFEGLSARLLDMCRAPFFCTECIFERRRRVFGRKFSL